MKITVKTDLKEFRKEKKQEVAAMLSRSGKVCRDAIGVYYRWLAQYSPPNIGSDMIAERLYERPAILLPIAIARGGRNLAADKAALAQGYSWKVTRKRKAPLYFKGKGGVLPPDAKRAQHIVNRGLLRWAFVGVLPDVGVAIPTVMRPLAAAKRGRNLKKNERLVASATLSESPNQLIIRVSQHMHAAGKGSWFGLAAKNAEKKHDAYMKLMLSKFGKVYER